jgi:type III restriction enzyme
MIIDEEHMFGGKQAKKSEKVLQNIQPKLEIRISATPITTNPEEKVTVHRQMVIEEQMIKEGVVINPALDFTDPNSSLNQHLIHLALKKREELAEAYRKLGVNINPLLLIQLPNDGSDTMDSDDASIKEEVVQYLNVIKNINTTNGKLAVWLSGEKENVEGLEQPDNLTEVLLFKQAIALGWDCPRAAVLLIFRKIESFTFGAQTVGRILRMPEQRFYEDDRLNKGYVYTNISQNYVKIEPDDLDYLSTFHSIRRENLCNVNLQSEYCEYPAASRKRLGSDFKTFMVRVFEDVLSVNNMEPSLFTLEELEGKDPLPDEEHKSQAYKNRQAVMDKIEFNVSSIGIEIIEDLNITGEVGQSMRASKAKYVRTMQELNTAFLAFCAKMIGSKFEKVSVVTLASVLKEVMEELFEVFETNAVKVILYHKNRPRFADIITRALDRYLKHLIEKQKEKSEKSYVKYEWEVPADRIYKEDTNVLREDVKNHALMPFVQLKNASNPEQEFEQYLEDNTEYIDWWYKNGDSGKQHYAISYIGHNGDKALFYVDFVIRMKNGQIFLFDTKTCGSDGDGDCKHNALIEYMDSEGNKEKHLKGGVLIHDGENWKYSPMKVDNITDITNWDSFYPSDYKE